MRIIFAGNNDYSAKHLSFLLSLKNKCIVVGVLTKFNKFHGKNKKKLNFIKILNKKFNIPYIELENFENKKDIDWIVNKKADLMIVVSFGLLIPKSVINIFPLGCFNFHASLLPRWRGPSPIQYCILYGDTETGVTLIKLNSKLDSGDIVDQMRLFIDKKDNAVTLLKKILYVSIKMLGKFIFLLNDKKKIVFQKQNEKLATFSKKFVKKDGLINWNDSVIKIHRCIKALYPWPSSYFFLENKLIKIKKSNFIVKKNKYIPGTILDVDKNGIKIKASDGILIILELQIQGGIEMSVKDFLNSNRKIFVVGDLC